MSSRGIVAPKVQLFGKKYYHAILKFSRNQNSWFGPLSLTTLTLLFYNEKGNRIGYTSNLAVQKSAKTFDRKALSNPIYSSIAFP